MPLNQHKLITLLRGVIIGGILFLVFPLLFAAQSDNDKVGTVAASFLQSNPSPRQSALGGDQTALHGHLDTLYSNPAGLATLSFPELWITHNRAFLETRANTLGFGLPVKGQTWAFSLQHVDDGQHEKIDVDSNNNPIVGLGDFRFSTTLLHIGWAKPIHQFAFGIGLKAWQDNHDGTNTSSWATDLGFQWLSALPNLDFGVAYKNLGPSIDGFDLPSSLTTGLAYHIPFTTLYSELDFASHRDTTLRGGIQLHNNTMWIRTGYESLSEDNLNESLGNLSFGAGVRIKGWKVDYALTPKGDLGDQHRVSVTLGFGLSPEERAQAAKAFDKVIAKRMESYGKKLKQDGINSQAKGDWEQAAEYYTKSLSWNPDDVEVQQSLHHVQHKAKVVKANQLYEQGLQFAHEDQWLDATSKWKQAIELNPHHTQANERLKKAQLKITPANNKNENIQTETYNKGIQHYIDGEYEMALKEWKEIRHHKKQFPKMGEYIEKAEKMILASKLESLEKTHPASSDEINNLSQQAYTLYSLGQTDKAIQVWQKVLALDPSNKDAKLSMREAKEKQKLLSNGTTVTPKHRVQELNTQALKAYQNGNLTKAQFLWKKALGLDPQNIWIQNNLKRIEKELITSYAK